MLIKWATEKERVLYGYNKEEFKDYDVLVAVDRMSKKIMGIVGISREKKEIGEIKILEKSKEKIITEKLHLCADRQCNPKGHSFHYMYPIYEKETSKDYCPCCNNEPQPNGLLDIAELEFSWATAERIAQGRLFGKCHVLCKFI